MDYHRNLDSHVLRFVNDGEDVYEVLWEPKYNTRSLILAQDRSTIISVDLYRYRQPARAEYMWRVFLSSVNPYKLWRIMDAAKFKEKHSAITVEDFVAAGVMGEDEECVVGTVVGVVKKDHMLYFTVNARDDAPSYFNYPNQNDCVDPVTMTSMMASLDTTVEAEKHHFGYYNETTVITEVLIEKLSKVIDYRTHEWCRTIALKKRKDGPRLDTDLSPSSHPTGSMSVQATTIARERMLIEKEMAERNSQVEPAPEPEVPREKIEKAAKEIERVEVAKQSPEEVIRGVYHTLVSMHIPGEDGKSSWQRVTDMLNKIAEEQGMIPLGQEGK